MPSLIDYPIPASIIHRLQVPLLEVDGLYLVQSHTILRYLGRKHGWYTGTPAQLAKIDLVADGTEDVRKRLSTIKYSEKSDEEKSALYAHYFTVDSEAKLWLGYIESIVASSTTPFAASTPDATHADCALRRDPNFVQPLPWHNSCRYGCVALPGGLTIQPLSSRRPLARPARLSHQPRWRNGGVATDGHAGPRCVSRDDGCTAKSEGLSGKSSPPSELSIVAARPSAMAPKRGQACDLFTQHLSRVSVWYSYCVRAGAVS